MFIFHNCMFDSILLNNPYAKIYEQCGIIANADKITKEEATNLIRHLGFMYNTFGKAIKDFVKIISYQFDQPQVKPIPTEPKFFMKKIKQQQSSSNLFENGPTQNPQMKDQGKQRKKSQGNNKKKSITIKQLPRIANAQEFEMQFMKQQIHDVQQQLKAQAEMEESKNIQHFNNLSRFNSQFTKGKPTQPLHLSNPYKNNNEILLIWPKDHQNDRQKSEHTLLIPKNDIDNVPYINLQASTDQQKVAQDNRQRYNFFGDIQERQANSYSRAYGGKKRSDKQKMAGITCIECQKYYKVMQLEGPGPNHCACTSRHRTNKQAAKKVKNNFTQQFDCL